MNESCRDVFMITPLVHEHGVGLSEEACAIRDFYVVSSALFGSHLVGSLWPAGFVNLSL